MIDYLQFWGKAGGVRIDEPAWHPNAYHCLDVAASAEALLIASPRKLAMLARLLGTSPDNARLLIVCLISLHDVGKFASNFQKKVPGLWPSAVLGEIAKDANNQSVRHDQTGFELRGKLKFEALAAPAFSQWTQSGSDIARLWGAIAGHHGRPVPNGGPIDIVTGMSTSGINAACAFARDAAALFGPFDALPERETEQLAAVSWVIAGLTNIADWVGSNRDRFPYCQPDATLAEYWPNAQTKAADAVVAAGILPSRASNEPNAGRLFPLIKQLSPLQAHVSDCGLPPGPVLAIIEDVTGSGKTEAALILAARLLTEGRADGIFFALPTMATANAMFDRLSETYRLLFDDNAEPSLVLAHGRSALHDGFQASILDNGIKLAEYLAERQGDESSATCAAWIADDRRKAFLAHVGVGTIDQALLGVLPSKHQALRLWGLSDRILIVDEAHAYDAYMSQELTRLMEFHAALGGSAIILSATLPSDQRKNLAAAFAKGLGGKVQVLPSLDYPLMTIVTGAGLAAKAVGSRPDRARNLPVRPIGDVKEAIAHVVDIASKGGAVAWIRNAVDDAIEAVELLRAEGLEPTLLHARFAMGDRLDIEERVRETLRKPDARDNSKRRGFVLVGTQILEQSLDYDVDAMISDLAPIDLMIQRAGRLWRHTDRTGRPVTAAELLVLSPNPAEVLDRDWYRQISTRAAAVYDHHGLVWRSAKVLFEAGAIETPGGVRGLVEAVYGNRDADDVPEPLREASNDAEGRRNAERSIAGANLLDFRSDYGGQKPAIWTSDTVTPTRLGQPVTTFRLGRTHADRIVPWYPVRDGDLRRAWALSEVSLNQNKAAGVPEPDVVAAKLITAAKADWSEWEQEQPLLLVQPDGSSWSGVVTDKAKAELPVAYCKRLGLRLVAGA